MTESLIKPIKLGKESNALLKKAFSSKNRKKVEDFNKNVRPSLSGKNHKNKLTIDEIMEAYK
ncbi:hypothetical protein ACWIWK_01805 [Helicobacter sp. 23-1048]